ncbi:MAG TPA: UDP-3-O-(3-hydroxymyristoyl)glucosamine N-acyltransferase [Blastocatellia bacterium]|nr:UDP-3-O-(3-hydroxymyristoyl)glucosamine N-acyltransferase [Blastocatellia bacterium]
MHSLGKLAELIKADLRGDPAAIVRRARSFDLAEDGDITLASDQSYRDRVNDSNATALIVSSMMDGVSKNLLIAANPKLAFARAIQALHGAAYEPTVVSDDFAVGRNCVLGVDLSILPRVTVGDNVVIGDRVTLHPGAVIGNNCHIGDDTIIHPNVTIYHDCRVGSRCIVHAGTVIGADGFGFVPDEQGHQVKLLHLGRVVVEDDCEIGANCAIDRAGFGDTILRRGVKLDNLIQIGHNCELGENTVVAALTGFSGGTRVGANCVIAGQVGTNQHVTIGQRVVVTARAGVTKDVPDGAVIGGMIPARDLTAWRKVQVIYSRLPELANKMKELERSIEELKLEIKGKG